MGAKMRDASVRWLSLITLLFAVSMLYAGEPWMGKSWAYWTEKDIQKILTDSPWAQPVPVPYHPLKNGEQIETSPPPAVSIGHIPDPNPLESHPVFRPDQVFIARWESAKTIRKALFRKDELRADSSQPRSAKVEELEKVPKEYLISVRSNPLNQLPPAYENRLKENSELTLRSSGKHLYPVRVVIRYMPESPDPDSFEFYFARMDESGRELVGPTEDQIDFKAQVGPRIFRARFKPAKMRDRQGPDL
jgi:hypothetical protein